MSHLGRHRNDLETWRAYAASAGETVAELVAAWDGWQPREIDLGGGYAAPRDPNTWVHGGDLAAAAGARGRGRRRGARERSARGRRRARAAGRRGARDRAGTLAARRHRHPPHARRQSQAAARAARVALGRDRHDRDVPARPARRALPLPGRGRHSHGRAARASRSTSSAARAASTCSRARCACRPSSSATRWRFSTPAPTRTAARPTSMRCRGPRSCSSAATGAEIVRRAETIEDVFARDLVPERLRP